MMIYVNEAIMCLHIAVDDGAYALYLRVAYEIVDLPNAGSV